MHALFAAKTPNGSTGHSDAKNYSLAAYSSVPAVPPSVNPPASPDAPVAFAAAPSNMGGDYMSSSAPSSPAVASAARSEPAKPSANSPVRVASAAPSSSSEGFFSSLARKIGIGGSETTASTTPAPVKQAAAPKAKPVVAPAKPPASSVKSSEPKVAAKPQTSEPKDRDTAMAGAQPIVSGNAFDNRWSLR